eukprot:GFYU01021167.1.p1 GENE.GFYU01021167.1~~GFYU01021167.1.p1  ORF type:complete len:193 (+),score=17.32 GFYU01021167.1:516-1094(+)
MEHVSWNLFPVAWASAVTLTVVFWYLIYPIPDMDWTSYQFHGGNCIVVMLELFLSKAPYPFSHIVYLCLYLVLYLGVVMFAHFYYKTWVYNFLAVHTVQQGARVYSGLFLMFSVAFSLGWCLTAFRDWLGESYCRFQLNRQHSSSVLGLGLSLQAKQVPSMPTDLDNDDDDDDGYDDDAESARETDSLLSGK